MVVVVVALATALLPANGQQPQSKATGVVAMGAVIGAVPSFWGRPAIPQTEQAPTALGGGPVQTTQAPPVVETTCEPPPNPPPGGLYDCIATRNGPNIILEEARRQQSSTSSTTR